jgi:hypothetical protein
VGRRIKKERVINMSDDVKKYTSLYDIKNFALNTIGPKYFPEDVIEGYNVGLLGYSLELMTNTTEDIFNTVPIVANEMFPNLAQMPNSIYNYASLFQEYNLLATPAVMECVLLLPMDSLLQHSSYGVDASYKHFILDQRTKVVVENHSFILDYDILITMRPYRKDYIITCSYLREYNNSMSEIVNPYIKYQKYNYNGTRYIALLVKMRRCDKFEYTTRVINNDRLNFTTIHVPFTDQLAGFEVFYRESTDQKFTQLRKKLVNSKAIKEPFCYYKLKTDKLLELTFTTRENYFKPLFNSELKVEYYTTTGSEGNFELYTGNEVEVYRNYDKYENNARVPVIAIIDSASSMGKDIPDLIELRDKVADCFATVNSYTTESDLQRHFNSFDITNGVKVNFIKKRDDIFDRLYTSFSLTKDSYGSYYKTNTLQLKIYPTQFDYQFEQSDRKLLKPSNVFVYDGLSTNCMIKLNDSEITDLAFNNTFVYQNPFLMTATNNGMIGYYLNNINDKIRLDYEYVNDSSMVQFICNNLYVYRSSLRGDNTYKFKVYLTATDVDIESPMIDEFGNDTNRLHVVLSFLFKNGKEAGYIECTKTHFDKEGLKYVFEGEITTDDFITDTETVRLYGLKDMTDGSERVTMVPMTNLKMNVYTFFEYEANNTRHNYTHLPGFENTTMTNKYTTEESRVELITPLNMLKSHMSWEKDKYGATYMLIKDVPVMKYKERVSQEDVDEFDRFMKLLSAQYDYMYEIMSNKTNNYSVDMKFYNTFGRSNNFVVGDNQEVLNHVNCTLELKVYPFIRSEGAQLVQDMKIFIKEYFENVNKDVNEGIFISNLIQELENTFSGIRYLKFVSINGYDNDYQSIENITEDVTMLKKEDRILFVPEYLNIELDDIIIELIN